MAKNSTTKSTVDVAAVEENSAATVIAVEENMNNEETKKNTKREIKVELSDNEEIEVVSLIPNVSYKDSKTGDFYEWDEVGHIEFMTFETLKNMWRNNKGYFKDLCLRPNDDRVVNKFGLGGTYQKYEFLMDESNYTRNNVKEICSVMSSMSNAQNGLKYSIVHKIKTMVVDGKLNDVHVIRDLEKQLNLDLVSLL